MKSVLLLLEIRASNGKPFNVTVTLLLIQRKTHKPVIAESIQPHPFIRYIWLSFIFLSVRNNSLTISCTGCLTNIPLHEIPPQFTAGALQNRFHTFPQHI